MDATQLAHVVVFLDQQGRNTRAITGDSCETYDRVALPIAIKLAENPDLRSIGTALFCFITLCLRHSRNLEYTQLAQDLLERECGSNALIRSFLRENSSSLHRLKSLAFVEDALHRDRPVECELGDSADVIAIDWEECAKHPLCTELRNAVEFVPRPLLLSYSGGVDSTCLLVLLKAAGIDFRCLFLRHDNREESNDEAETLKSICASLRVQLFMYHVRLKRPHDGEERLLGISREEYERWTKEIRFTMYKHLATNVLLGHHMDDIDENRLEQLSSGHILGDLDGMSAERTIDGVTLQRPLLHCRKAQFRDILRQFPVPYLKDSTPQWSVRGSLRRAIDEKPSLQPILGQVSRQAKEIGQLLDARLAQWETSVETREPEQGLPRRLVLDYDQLAVLTHDIEYDALLENLEVLRSLFNPVELPLKNIPPAKTKGYVVFERAFCTATQFLRGQGGIASVTRMGHYHTSNRPLVNRKAVAHLWSNILSAKSDFGGGLTQEIGYFCVPPRLLLYDTTTTPKSCQDLKSHFRHVLKAQ